jgi:hypothetical protein
MIFTIYILIDQIRLMIKLKKKYFHQFWAYLEIGILVCSWTSMGIYIWRYEEDKRIGTLFQQTNGYVYINLQMTVYINNVLLCLMSICCIFAWIKFVRLCRFNR